MSPAKGPRFVQSETKIDRKYHALPQEFRLSVARAGLIYLRLCQKK